MQGLRAHAALATTWTHEAFVTGFFSPILRQQAQQIFRNLEFRREILEFRKKFLSLEENF